jgi:hypothetical protein
MKKEHHTILKNDVWDNVTRPEGKSILTSKWIYKIKQAADGSVKKYKVIFVAKRFSQIGGVVYDETFDPVARYNSIHTIILELETTSYGCKENISQW